MRCLPICAAIALLAASGGAAEEAVSVEPVETQELFANPGMGWQTFGRPADKDPSFGALPSSVMYVRYYWAQIEKSDGVCDWGVLDDAIAEAAAAGQQAAFRVMTAGTTYGNGKPRDFSPPWLKEAGCRFHTYTTRPRPGRNQGPFECPDFNDPVFLEKHIEFIRAMGRRYNAHPNVCLVDVGSIGLWGEWHMSGTDVPMPTEENARRIISAYRHAFPDTPLVMQLDDVPGMKFAKGLGVGWRVDCWGDMGGFSDNWCHMRSLYPKSIRETGVENLWRTAPVALETCWDMRKWHSEGWDIDYILDWALEQHASFINNKSAPVPPELLGKVEKWLRKIGYRFVLRKASWPARVGPGAPFSVDLEWENVGVAPCYFDFHPALMLLDAEGEVAWRQAFDEESFRLKGPGAFRMRLEAAMPKDLPAGQYDLAIAIVGASGEPTVRIAIEGRREDGSYSLGPIAAEED